MAVWRRSHALAYAIAVLCFVITNGAVLSIDFGSQNMKVSLIKPGSPFQVVTNPQSKRKTPTSVAFYQGERLFGSDAESLSRRRPHFVFNRAALFLGRSLNHSIVESYTKSGIFPFTVTESNVTGGVNYVLPSSTETYEIDRSFSAEQIASMLLQYAKGFAEPLAGRPIRDVVITVPVFYTYDERSAILNAAQLAGLNVLALVDDPVAAAVQFAIDKLYVNETHTMLIVDVGAHYTQAAVVAYDSYRKGKGTLAKDVGQAHVLSKAWEENAGGATIDELIAQVLADEFNAKHGPGTRDNEPDIRTLPRSMAKLRAACTKTKEILSANEDFPIIIESLTPDIDFRSSLSRSKLEELSSSLVDRIVSVASTAVTRAGLTISDLNDVEIVGGGVRVPLIQRKLKEVLNRKQLSVHLNGDEAMTLGAAFIAANRSKTFRVRPVGLLDSTEFPIGVTLTEAEPSKETEAWVKQLALFNRGDIVPAVRKLSVRRDTDVVARLYYDESAPLSVGTNYDLQEFRVSGVDTVVTSEANKRANNTVPKINFVFELDQYGLINLKRAEAIVEEFVTIPVKSNNASSAEKEANGSIVNGTASNDTNSTNDASSDAAPTTQTKKKIHRFPLKVTRSSLRSVQELTPNDFEQAFSVLQELQDVDRLRALRAQAKNELETFIYSQRDKLINSEYEAVEAVTTPEQRENFTQMLEAAEDWLYEDGGDASSEQYQEKKNELQKAMSSMWLRVAELEARPKAIAYTKQVIANITQEVAKWSTEKPQITDQERTKVETQVQGLLNWLSEQQEEQDKLEAHDDPILTSAAIKSRLGPIQKSVRTLARRPRPTPTPSPSSTANDTTQAKPESSSSASPTSTPAAEEQTDSASSEKVEL